MVSQRFVEGCRHGLETVKAYCCDVAAALERDDTHEAQKAMATMVGHAINAQAVLAAKIAYELSEAEKGVEQ